MRHWAEEGLPQGCSALSKSVTHTHQRPDPTSLLHPTCSSLVKEVTGAPSSLADVPAVQGLSLVPGNSPGGPKMRSTRSFWIIGKTDAWLVRKTCGLLCPLLPHPTATTF